MTGLYHVTYVGRMRGLRRTVFSSRRQRGWTLEVRGSANERDLVLAPRTYVVLQLSLALSLSALLELSRLEMLLVRLWYVYAGYLSPVCGLFFSYPPFMALNGLKCAGVPLRNYSLTHTRLRLLSWMYRMSNTPGNPGNLLELFFLLEIYWKFTKFPGNFLVYFVSLHICR